MLLFFPKKLHQTPSRAAKRAMASAVSPQARPVLVRKIGSHHSAGMLSRCDHLRTAATPAPMSAANSSAEGHNSTTARKDEIAMPRSLGQSVLNGKAKVSLDCQGKQRQSLPMSKNDVAASEYREAFIERMRLARKNRNLSQKDTALLLGLEQGTYKQYETRSLLPHYLVPRFCIACDIDPSWLFMGDGKALARPPVAKKRSRRRRQPPPRRIA